MENCDAQCRDVVEEMWGVGVAGTFAGRRDGACVDVNTGKKLLALAQNKPPRDKSTFLELSC